ncbi:MAG TPA: PsbP-related protein [Planctomycetota bacterium]|nr:PsbP-related protein [Planctomycetota bacterium]
MQIQKSLALVYILCAVANAADKIFADKNLGFEITLPDSWSITDSLAKGGTLTAVSPKSPGANGQAELQISASVDKQVHKRPQLLNDEELGNLKNKVKAIEQAKIKVGNAEGIRLRHTEEDQSTIFFLVAGKHVVHMTFVVRPHDSEIYEGDIERIVNSLRIVTQSTVVSKTELGFEIAFPESWTVTENSATIVRALSMLANGASEHATVDVLEAKPRQPTALADWADSIVKMESSNKEMGGYMVIEKKDLTVAGASAMKLVVNCEVSNTAKNATRTVQLVSYLVATKARNYRILAAATKGEFDHYAADIDDIVKSFKLLDSK